MDINIKRNLARHTSLFKMKSRLDMRKTNMQILLLFALGFVPAIVGLDDLTPRGLNAGFLLIGASLMLYYQTHLKKRISNIKPIGFPPKKHDVAETEFNLKLDDLFITTESAKRYIRVSWDLVKSYRFYKDHLLILTDKKYLSAFVVKKDEVTPLEFEELSDFLKAKFAVK